MRSGQSAPNRESVVALASQDETSQPSPALEVISKIPSQPRAVPPLLFVHGAWHGAWCWNEGFLDYFADRGYAAHALSLRGHGASEGRKSLRFARVRDYVADVAKVAATLPSAPILIGHSMGGFVVQKYLETRSAPAAVLLASAPPTGVWRVAMRAMRDQPLDSLKCNVLGSLWPMISDTRRARRLMFSSSMPEADIERFHSQMQDESVFSYLDTLFLDLVNPAKVTTPMIVLGGGDDQMIKPGEVIATAKAYKVEPTILNGLAHDMMLDTGWRRVADAIIKKLDVRLQSEVLAGSAQANAA